MPGSVNDVEPRALGGRNGDGTVVRPRSVSSCGENQAKRSDQRQEPCQVIGLFHAVAIANPKTLQNHG